MEINKMLLDLSKNYLLLELKDKLFLEIIP